MSSEIWNEEYPFPVTVKFMVTDTIAALRPKLKMYESLEDAIQGVQDLINELKPKLVEVCPNILNEDDEEKSKVQTPAQNDSLGPIEEVDEEVEDDAQSEGSYHEGETEGDTDGFSGSQSQPFEDENEVSSRHGMSQQSDVENDQIYDASEDAPNVKLVTKQVQSAEDEDFMTAFDRMLSESILHRNQESVKPQVDIVIPMNIKGSNKKAISVFELKEEEKPTINFVLMTRRGNKQQFKNLAVPVTSELAQNLKDREEAERMEKQHVKLLTLNINERQEEEDYQEMLAAQQRPSVMNLNRDRRQKYHHPKGAPDADLIFGNK